MAILQVPAKFPIPNFIGQLLKEKNPGSELTILSAGQWILEGSTIYIYSSWFNDIYPKPFDQAIYTILRNISWGNYKKMSENSVIISDSTPVNVNIALPFECAVVIEELASRFNLTASEAIVGLLTQFTAGLVRNS